MSVKPAIRDLSVSECENWFAEMGEPPYRVNQLWRWLYRNPVAGFENMTNLPKGLREVLHGSFRLWSLNLSQIESADDGTVKLLWSTPLGEHLESVLIPMLRRDEGRAEPHHLTICVSTQIGCARGCTFCLTGVQGFSRNLSVAEILDQVLFTMVWLKGGFPETEAPPLLLRELPLSNVVFMGMGEPLDNYHSVLRASSLLANQVGFSHRKITISTVGVVPKILKLSKEPEVFSLALSLHAANDEVRWRIMPRKRHYPLKDIVEALRVFPLPPRKRFTVEYVMLKDVNDSLSHAKDLVRLLNPLRCKVNLIPYNPFPGSPYAPSPMHRIEEFQGLLRQKGLSAFIRASRGREILAGCGQLRWKVEHG